MAASQKRNRERVPRLGRADEHGDDLPVHREAWPDWWTDGFGSAARETAARARPTWAPVQPTLLAMASLLALASAPTSCDCASSAVITDALLFYDEHTFGAAESIAIRSGRELEVQWGEKSAVRLGRGQAPPRSARRPWGGSSRARPRNAPRRSWCSTRSAWRAVRPRRGVRRPRDPAATPRSASSTTTRPRGGRPAPAARADGTYWGLWRARRAGAGFADLADRRADAATPAPQPARRRAPSSRTSTTGSRSTPSAAPCATSAT